MSDDWQQFDEHRVRLTPRPAYNGQPVHADALPFVGAEATAYAAWRCDDDERYAGEWALRPVDGTRLFGRAWIASGDVEIVE